MGKQTAPRREADNEAKAIGRMIRTSPQKLNLVARSIRGKKVEAALADLTFSEKADCTGCEKSTSVRCSQCREQS